LRQELCKSLDLLRTKITQKPIASSTTPTSKDRPATIFSYTDLPEQFAVTKKIKPRFNLVLRNHEQTLEFVDAYKTNHNELKSLNLGYCILDYEFGRSFSTSIDALKALGLKTGLATTRILKPSEYRNLDALARLSPDAILVRNLGALKYLKKIHCSSLLFGDFSLNVANHLTANYLLNKGLNTICSSYDLNAEQIAQLLKQTDQSKLEVTVHQHMPSFHMEHCVFAAYLSEGSSYKDCGKPCERFKVELKDQFNNRHLIKADQECRNTMFNFRSQTALGYLKNWINQGLSILRYEALHESGKTIAQNLMVYHRFLNEQLIETDAIKQLEAIESYGLVDGSFGHEHKYRSRKKTGLTQSRS
jgi:putative protease